MLIKFFRSSFIIQYFVLVIIAASLWVPGFINNQGTPVTPAIITPLYNLALYIINLLPVISPLLAAIMVFISALTLNNILVFHELTPKNNILPAFIFILLMSSNPLTLCSYPVIIALPLLTWFLHTIFKMNDEPENYMEVFNASILVSVISMIYPLAVILFPFVWLSLLIYGTVNSRNIIISLIAFLLPYIYLFFYFFWKDELGLALNEYVHYFGRILSVELNKSILQLAVWGVFVIFMLIPAYMRITGTLGSFNINFRKKMAATAWMVIFSIPMIIYSGKADLNTFIFLPAAIMIAHYYHLFKKSVMNEIAVLLFLLLLLLNNYLPIFNA